MRLEELFESIPIESWNKKDLVGYEKYLDLFENGKTVPYLDGEWNKGESTVRIYNANRSGITSMKGAPKIINGSFAAGNNPLSSFEFAPEIVKGRVIISEDKFKDLHNIHKHFKEIDGELYAENMDLDGPMLGLLKIKKLKRVIIDDMEIGDIINKYLPLGDVLECQQELINAGYEAQAKL